MYVVCVKSPPAKRAHLTQATWTNVFRLPGGIRARARRIAGCPPPSFSWRDRTRVWKIVHPPPTPITLILIGHGIWNDQSCLKLHGLRHSAGRVGCHGKHGCHGNGLSGLDITQLHSHCQSSPLGHQMWMRGGVDTHHILWVCVFFNLMFRTVLCLELDGGGLLIDNNQNAVGMR